MFVEPRLDQLPQTRYTNLTMQENDTSTAILKKKKKPNQLMFVVPSCIPRSAIAPLTDIDK